MHLPVFVRPSLLLRASPGSRTTCRFAAHPSFGRLVSGWRASAAYRHHTTINYENLYNYLYTIRHNGRCAVPRRFAFRHAGN